MKTTIRHYYFSSFKYLLTIGLLQLKFFKADAQRTIEFFEPDYDTSYCLHAILFENMKNDPACPVHYNQFFSATAKEKGIRQIEKRTKGYLKTVIEISCFDRKGLLISRTIKKYSSENNNLNPISIALKESYKYNFKKNKIIAERIDNMFNTHETYYFNTNCKIDSTRFNNNDKYYYTYSNSYLCNINTSSKKIRELQRLHYDVPYMIDTISKDVNILRQYLIIDNKYVNFSHKVTGEKPGVIVRNMNDTDTTYIYHKNDNNLFYIETMKRNEYDIKNVQYIFNWSNNILHSARRYDHCSSEGNNPFNIDLKQSFAYSVKKDSFFLSWSTMASKGSFCTRNDDVRSQIVYKHDTISYKLLYY